MRQFILLALVDIMSNMSRNLPKQKLDNGGFRVAWFIPIEMLMFGTMLGLSPYLGIGWSVVLVGVPAMYGLSKLSKLQDKLTKPYLDQERERLSKLSHEEMMEHITSYDFFTPAWYEEQVLAEMFATLNPFKRLHISVPKLSSKQSTRRVPAKNIA